MAHDFTIEASDVDRLPAADVRRSRPALASYLKALWSRRNPNSDVERFIMANGGVLTDSLEREISRRFGRITD